MAELVEEVIKLWLFRNEHAYYTGLKCGRLNTTKLSDNGKEFHKIR